MAATNQTKNQKNQKKTKKKKKKKKKNHKHMAAKQYATKQPQGHQRNQRGNFLKPWRQMKMETQ